MKAIIIGAGIGGLTTAIALQKSGMQVEVYEQAPEARAVGAGLTLWANAIRALQQIDADDALATSIMDVSGTIHRWDGITLSAFDPQWFKQRYATPIIGIHREDLMYGLLAKAGNVVQFGKKLARYEQDAAAVHVHFEDGSIAHGDVLVGTDGIRSAVRRQMQPDAQPIYRGYAAWRGVISFPHQQVGTMWGEIWGHGARFGIVPLNHERLYWFATANRPANTPPADHKAVLHQLFGTWHHPIPQIIKATPDASVLYNDIADLEPLNTWRDGRVVLLGDAAHAMTPNMGQGACQAIEDAVVLGRVCRQYPTVHEALKRYEADRLAHTSRVILRSRMIGRIGQITHPLGVVLRDGMMRVMPARMSAQQFDFVLSKAL